MRVNIRDREIRKGGGTEAIRNGEKKRGKGEMVKCRLSCEEDIKAALQCLPLISAQNIAPMELEVS